MREIEMKLPFASRDLPKGTSILIIAKVIRRDHLARIQNKIVKSSNFLGNFINRAFPSRLSKLRER